PVDPHHLAVDLDPLFRMWRDKNSAGAHLVNRIGGLECKSFFRGIEDNSAASPLKLKVGNSPWPLPRGTPSFGPHSYVGCHWLCVARVFFEYISVLYLYLFPPPKAATETNAR